MKRPHQHRTLLMGAVDCRWTCGPGALRSFFAMVSSFGDPVEQHFHDIAQGPIVIVTDENVNRLHGLELPPGIPRIVVPPGESSKTLASLERVLQSMLDAGLDRDGTVIAFGGGVVGDLAGFAAAIFMRGVRWVNVPTTLLAMADASIGGKTAVDVNDVKNLAGAFHPPAAIVADPLVLATLPAAERAAGMSEVVKQALVGSPSLFERLERGLFDDAGDIGVAAQVKMDIVERDPYERGERAVLNLGHTVGHGVESAAGFRLTHGEAVAIGLVAECRIAEALGLASSGLCDRVATTLRRFGLPTHTTVGVSSVRAAMTADKKRVQGLLRFALPRSVSDVVYAVEVEEAIVMEALREVCGR